MGLWRLVVSFKSDQYRGCRNVRAAKARRLSNVMWVCLHNLAGVTVKIEHSKQSQAARGEIRELQNVAAVLLIITLWQVSEKGVPQTKKKKNAITQPRK